MWPYLSYTNGDGREAVGIMVKRRIVHTYKLEPGMVLAEDLLDLRSGVVLIKKIRSFPRKCCNPFTYFHIKTGMKFTCIRLLI